MTGTTRRERFLIRVDSDDTVGQNETDPAQELDWIDIERIDVGHEQAGPQPAEFREVELTPRGEARRPHRSQNSAERRNLGILDAGEAAGADHFWEHFQERVRPDARRAVSVATRSVATIASGPRRSYREKERWRRDRAGFSSDAPSARRAAVVRPCVSDSGGHSALGAGFALELWSDNERGRARPAVLLSRERRGVAASRRRVQTSARALARWPDDRGDGDGDGRLRRRDDARLC